MAITELNDFMQSILGSLDAAVIVVEEEMYVQVWTHQAEELWGLRERRPSASIDGDARSTCGSR